MKTFLPIVLFFGCSLSALMGEDNTAAKPVLPPPQAPWVAPVPERGQWAVHISDPRTKPTRDREGNEVMPAGVNRLPVRIDSMTWNAVKRDIFTFSDGSKATVFYYAGFVLLEGVSASGKAAPVLVQQLPGTDYSALRSGGWLGMEWLQEKFYVGTEYYRSSFLPADVEPTACYFYQKPAGNLPGSDNWVPEIKAWVRAQDLQPVAFSIGSRVFEFLRLDPPIAAPEMTKEQAARLLDLKAKNERMDRLRERNKRLRGE